MITSIGLIFISAAMLDSPPPEPLGRPIPIEAAPRESVTSHEALPEIAIDRDNLVISESCRIKPGTYLVPDTDNNGVVHIRGDGIVVDFAGATLLGAPEGTPQDQLDGIGVSIHRSDNATILNANVHGFKNNFRLTKCESVVLERCDASRGYGQRIAQDGQVRDEWLHLRDLNAWRSYGAGFWIEDCEGSRVFRCVARHMQNGLLLVESKSCEIVQSDFCFNSGWGLGLWASSHNRVMSNLIDFVNRPWGGGWGGDAAGLVVVNESDHNQIVGNSFTHGGDGFFLTNRRDVGDPQAGSCNHNLIAFNDGSYSPHNAFEATFSDGNMFVGNLATHSHYGFWCGFSNDSLYVGNTITDNRACGIATEHGHGHRVEANDIARNGTGVRFWHDPGRGYPSEDHAVCNNRFLENGIAVEFLQTKKVRIDHNAFRDNDWAIRVAEGGNARAAGNLFVIEERGQGFINGDLDARRNAWQDGKGRELSSLCLGDVNTSEPAADAGPMTPYRESALPQGIDTLIAGDWAPLDFTSELVYPKKVTGGREIEFAVVGRGRFELKGVPEGVTVESDRQTAPARVRLRCDQWKQFTCTVAFLDLDKSEQVAVAFMPVIWRVRFYGWTPEGRIPPKDPFGGEVLDEQQVERIQYRWHMDRPGDKVPGDGFAVRAETEMTLPKGEYVLSAVSDDGVRVKVDDKMVIDNWTWHHTTEDRAILELSRGKHRFVVEYFEINGAARLEFDLTPVE